MFRSPGMSIAVPFFNQEVRNMFHSSNNRRSGDVDVDGRFPVAPHCAKARGEKANVQTDMCKHRSVLQLCTFV